MIFGECPLDAANGVILAHAVRLDDSKLAKGHRLTPSDIARLRSEGIDRVIAVRLEAGDLDEDEAADRLAASVDLKGLTRSPASTGRVNIYAADNGLFRADKKIVDQFNRIDPAITLATLADRSDVRTGDLVATIKIIPLAVAGSAVAHAETVLRTAAAFSLKAYTPRAVHLIATELPSLKPTVMDKTARVLEMRLQPSASRLVSEQRVPHKADAVAAAITRSLGKTEASTPLMVVFGAAAVCDENDVIPEAIRRAGGIVERVGLPVDPGNLLVLGHIGDVPVIGAPGCARSPKENGFDWVLNGILAGDPPSEDEMSGWGVGGLLMEIPARPLPRLTATGDQPAKQELAVVVLAAGRASRMGESGQHKLLATFGGESLVHRVVRHAVEADIGPVIVVTGHRAAEIAATVRDLPVECVENALYLSGMASSLAVGVRRAESKGASAVMVLLADMPNVGPTDLKRLVEAHVGAGKRAIIRATAGGKRGNPVILPVSTFEALRRLEGDIGARAVIETAGVPVIDIEIGAAARLDVDTPEAVLAAGGKLEG
ncbi:NTP transferase domain-containing protein [Rhizobium sp. G187]|uniref:NTP transferase domain-containing protein n=1 Tax=Rhizobium sp. G187 TaxID=3451352 RepID=UPI003EE76773